MRLVWRGRSRCARVDEVYAGGVRFDWFHSCTESPLCDPPYALIFSSDLKRMIRKGGQGVVRATFNGDFQGRLSRATLKGARLKLKTVGGVRLRERQEALPRA